MMREILENERETFVRELTSDAGQSMCNRRVNRLDKIYRRKQLLKRCGLLYYVTARGKWADHANSEGRSKVHVRYMCFGALETNMSHGGI